MASVRMHRNRDGVVGCTIGISPAVGAVGYGADGADALHTAAAAAQQLVVLADTHPELAPLINQDTVKGLRALAAAAGVVKQGGDANDVKNKVGPVAANVVSTLLKGFLF